VADIAAELETDWASRGVHLGSRATREDSGWKIEEPIPIRPAARRRIQ
jgi:hypothetical protein